MSNPIVVVKYQTETKICSCCNQKLPNPKTSKVREFQFSKEGALGWADWHAAAEFPEDMDSMVPDFVYETISFFATNFDEKIIIEDSEIEKVKEFILREFVVQHNEKKE
jgi:hypothetical protein